MLCFIREILAASPFLIRHLKEKSKLRKGWFELSSYSDQVKGRARVVIPGIGKHIELSKIHDVGKLLYDERHLIIRGEAGVGKSGFVLSLSQRHRNLQWVFLDCRDIGNCDSISSIEENIGIAEYDLPKVLSGKARKGKIIFVVDQCDSIWRSSNLEGLFRLVQYLLKIENLRIILVCRKEESEGIKEYLDERTGGSVREVIIQELEEETVLSILKEFGLGHPSGEIINIARNLFRLSILGEIYKNSGSGGLMGMNGFADYFEKYRLVLEKEIQDNTTKLRVTEKAAELAKQSLLEVSGSCKINTNLAVEEKVLLGRDVIRREAEDSIRCKFSHEKLRDYFYCYYAVRVEKKTLERIQGELQDEFSRIAPSMYEFCLKCDPEKSVELTGML